MTAAARAPKAVTYAGGTPVLPGDRVSVRFLLRRRRGEVIYVPGISKHRPSHEHHGLRWVGVSLPDGWATGVLVLPETGTLKRSVRFLGRGSESVDAAEAIRRLDAQEAEEAAREAEMVEPPANVPVEKPRPRDWLAGGVAVALQLGMWLLPFVVIGVAIRLLRRLF